MSEVGRVQSGLEAIKATTPAGGGGGRRLDIPRHRRRRSRQGDTCPPLPLDIPGACRAHLGCRRARPPRSRLPLRESRSSRSKTLVHPRPTLLPYRSYATAAVIRFFCLFFRLFFHLFFCLYLSHTTFNSRTSFTLLLSLPTLLFK
jgi:hypothetical protein